MKVVMKMKSKEVKIVKAVTACDILPVAMFPLGIEISWMGDRGPLSCLSDVHAHSDSSQLTGDHDNDQNHHHHLPRQYHHHCLAGEFLLPSNQLPFPGQSSAHVSLK